MKKTVKKLTAVGLTLTSVMSLVACGNTAGNKETEKQTQKEITKPGKFTVMVDNTVLAETAGGKEFYEYYKTLTGLEIDWVRPNHSNYYDAVANAFAGSDMPDVVLLSSDYYALYASNGFLWDMTEAWETSNTKSSGKLIETADNVLNALLVNGEDGKKAMYGFSPYRGNGCCTYIKKSWLTEAGVKVEDVEGKTLTFAEYYDILKKLQKNSASGYVISCPDFISDEAPYTNYLPEFYQKASYTFYADSTGKYVDGFSEQAMKDALGRIATAVKDGVIDKGSLGQKTSGARDKFYAKDAKNESGVFTYWAGTWAQNLQNNIPDKDTDSLVALNPIKELGSYVERIAPCWCITTHAENPEGIFKYFIDTMLDCGEVQVAWEYGAKGTHWDTKAETVTLATAKEGEAVKSYEYKEGEFHMLPAVDKPTSLVTKNHIDPILALTSFDDPGKDKISELAASNGKWFAENSKVAVPVPMTTELGENIGDINTARKEVVSKVALGEMTVDEGMEYYNKQVGSLVKTVLDSLNK